MKEQSSNEGDILESRQVYVGAGSKSHPYENRAMPQKRELTQELQGFAGSGPGL